MTNSHLTEARDGVRDILPPMIAAIPIALLFGGLCAAKGLSPLEVALMSAIVFAGGAQFAAVEIWAHPAPILVLAFSTLLINARHILMGASLALKTGGFTTLQRLIGFGVMADENWAMAERRAASRPLTPTYYLAMGAIFWVNWVAMTTLGAVGGSLMGDPKRLGADFAFSALFIGLIAGFWKGKATAITVAASTVAAALTYYAVGAPWHVAAGALAGIAAAYVFAEQPAERTRS